MGFETVIRPFQDRPIAPPNLVLDDTKQDPNQPQSIGAEGGTLFDYSYNFSGLSKSSGKDDWKETKRKSETVRIVNPDDEEQFVETTRATRVEFNDTETGKSKRSYNFKYPDKAVG